MRIIKFCLAVLFCLHAQSAKAGDGPIKQMAKVVVAGIGVVIAGPEALTIYAAYSFHNYFSTPDKKELDQHQEKFARLASLRAAQAQEDSDDDDDGSCSTCYVK